MKIEHKPTDSLIEYARNNKKHSEGQVDRIANSIVDFGFNQPIVVDEDNIVLVGHGRLRAAKKLGMDKVPVLQLSDLSETQKRSYRILDNKIADDAEWDFENLRLEFDALQEDNFEFADWDLGALVKLANPQLDEKDPSHLEVNADTYSAEQKLLIVVECFDEKHQRELFEEFESRDLKCKIIS